MAQTGLQASADNHSKDRSLLLLFPFRVFKGGVCVCVGRGGIQPGCGADWVKRQMKLSVIGGATQLTVGMQLKWVREDNESSVIKMMWRARPEHVKDQMTVCG